MTVEISIPGYAAGGFAFGNQNQDDAHAMRNAVAEQWADIEAPPPGVILELELTMDEARELVKWIKERFPNTKGATLQQKATLLQPAPTYH